MIWTDEEEAMLKREDTALIIIDIQGKLATLMHERDRLIAQACKLIRGAQALDIPVIWNEQYPRGLGPTIPEIAALLKEMQPLEKRSFSCCGSMQFNEALAQLNCRQLLVSGIETHICVYQTVRDLLSQGYAVEVAADAVSSRTELDMQTGLSKMVHAGASVTTVETALFELLGDSRDPAFKEISSIVK